MKRVHSEQAAVLIALASSCLGRTAAATTRHLADGADPLSLAMLDGASGFFATFRLLCCFGYVGRAAAIGQA